MWSLRRFRCGSCSSLSLAGFGCVGGDQKEASAASDGDVQVQGVHFAGVRMGQDPWKVKDAALQLLVQAYRGAFQQHRETVVAEKRERKRAKAAKRLKQQQQQQHGGKQGAALLDADSDGQDDENSLLPGDIPLIVPTLPNAMAPHANVLLLQVVLRLPFDLAVTVEPLASSKVDEMQREEDGAFAPAAVVQLRDRRNAEFERRFEARHVRSLRTRQPVPACSRSSLPLFRSSFVQRSTLIFCFFPQFRARAAGVFACGAGLCAGRAEQPPRWRRILARTESVACQPRCPASLSQARVRACVCVYACMQGCVSSPA